MMSVQQYQSLRLQFGFKLAQAALQSEASLVMMVDGFQIAWTFSMN